VHGESGNSKKNCELLPELTSCVGMTGALYRRKNPHCRYVAIVGGSCLEPSEVNIVDMWLIIGAHNKGVAGAWYSTKSTLSIHGYHRHALEVCQCLP